jgi:hypothetical protein
MPASSRYDKQVNLWYGRKHWKNLRTLVLARFPVCCMCHRAASTVADHIRPHAGVWEKFCDLNNLWGLCQPCHSKKTAIEDGGGFQALKPTFGVAIAATGSRGREFVSSSVSQEQLDKALANVDDLLSPVQQTNPPSVEQSNPHTTPHEE